MSEEDLQKSFSNFIIRSLLITKAVNSKYIINIRTSKTSELHGFSKDKDIIILKQ